MRALVAVALGGCVAVPDPPNCGPPRELHEIDTAQEEYEPVLFPDRREIVWTSNGRGGSVAHLFHAERGGTTGPFGNVQPLDTQGGVTADSTNAWLLADKTLLYSSGPAFYTLNRDESAPSRYGNTNTPVFPELSNAERISLSADQLVAVVSAFGALEMSRRMSTSDPFPNTRSITVDTGVAESGASISPDGETLLFARNDAANAGHVMRATRSGDDFVDAMPLDLSSKAGDEDIDPFAVPEGDTIVFASDRNGGTGLHDIWIYCE